MAQLVDPGCIAYVPAAQMLQLAFDPIAEEEAPIWHSVHCDDAAAAVYVPAAHIIHGEIPGKQEAEVQVQIPPISV